MYTFSSEVNLVVDFLARAKRVVLRSVLVVSPINAGGTGTFSATLVTVVIDDEGVVVTVVVAPPGTAGADGSFMGLLTNQYANAPSTTRKQTEAIKAGSFVFFSSPNVSGGTVFD